MDGKIAASSIPAHQEASNHDELYMQQRLTFSESLKEMKTLRKQLYSAAEYFEKCYVQEDQKQMVLETIKDYAVKSLISTVDHLGSAAYKVNSFLDEKIGEVSAMDIRFSCFEQRVETCQGYVNQSGIYQQSLLIDTPKHHKRYIIAVDDKMDSLSTTKPKPYSRNSHQFKNAVQAAIKGTPNSFSREWHSALQPPQISPAKGTFTLIRTSSNTKSDRRAVSPQCFPFVRSGSVQRRSTSPMSAKADRRYPSEPRRSASVSLSGEREKPMDIEQYSSKSKQLFKAMLSMRKARKEGALYKYLDQM